MKLSPNVIKALLAQELEKNGHTLMDLEDALSKLNTKEGMQKVAMLLGNEKIADFSPSDIMKALSMMGTAGAYGAVGAGGLGALGLYTANRKLDDEEAAVRESDAKRKQIEDATMRLRTEHGLM